MNTTYPSSGMSHQLRDEYYISKLWNVVSIERWILHIQALLECRINWEMILHIQALECRINWEMNTTYPGAARMSYQLRDEYYISKLWNVVSTERWILHIQALECRINWEMNTTYPSATRMSYQLRDEYYISKLWNVVSTERWILHIQALLECRINWEMNTTYPSAARMLLYDKFKMGI